MPVSARHAYVFSGVVNVSSCEGYQRRSVFCPISLNKTLKMHPLMNAVGEVLLKLFRIVKEGDERRHTRAFCGITWRHFCIWTSFFPNRWVQNISDEAAAEFLSQFLNDPAFVVAGWRVSAPLRAAGRQHEKSLQESAASGVQAL